MAAWEASPPGVDTEDVEERDRFIKLWLQKTMMTGGLGTLSISMMVRPAPLANVIPAASPRMPA